MSQITTHVLDTAAGKPAKGIAISLSQQTANGWLALGNGITNEDGRIANLLDASIQLAAGTYKMHFATEAYLEDHHGSAFYPFAEVVFTILGDGQHYHIPLLLQPFGYSTYRGS